MKLCELFLLVGSLSLGMVASSLADDKPKVLFDEAFTSPLDAGWTWIREKPNAWKVEDGKLLLRSLPGGPPGYVDEKDDVRNILLRKAPVTSKSLIIEVFVENQPELLYEHAALYWYYDDDNYIGLLKEWMGEEVMVRLVSHKESERMLFAGELTYAAEGVWFRLEIKGEKAKGYFRQTDKAEWRKIGQVDLPSQSEPQVGFNVGGGSEKAERWASFSRFRILEKAE